MVIVDTHLSPASMRAMRARIEEATGLGEFPYVINTHGHWDHCSGNQAFPQATILGHVSSPTFMHHHRANPLGTMWQEESVLAEDRRSLESTSDSVGYLSEDEFYILGNRFVDQSNLEAAAIVFELAGEQFPTSSLIFGGLGRVHLVRGDTLLAISAYQRAYDLAPNNRQAEAMLRRLRGR